MNDAPLRTTLLELLDALGPVAARVLLGGGYGLYLKQLHIAAVGGRTLIDTAVWPPPRGTNDLDLVLDTEVIASAADMAAVRAALDALGFEPLPEARYLQFVRDVGGGMKVKVDLLGPQEEALRADPRVRVKNGRRAGPSGGNRPPLHAHPTDGVLPALGEPLEIDVAGRTPSSGVVTRRVRLPHALIYLLMKLTAYRDRRGDAGGDFGRHHALDLYRIVAMTTPEEDRQIPLLLARVAGDPTVRGCAALVAGAFAARDAPGVRDLRRHADWPGTPEAEASLDVFCEALAAYIPPS